MGSQEILSLKRNKGTLLLMVLLMRVPTMEMQEILSLKRNKGTLPLTILPFRGHKMGNQAILPLKRNKEILQHEMLTQALKMGMRVILH